tara:strand:+ start:2064 stop:2309 length:246 start_codon:yes stop_codon:yes gene_type:complete
MEQLVKVQNEIKELENQLRIRDDIKQKEKELSSLKELLKEYKVDYNHRASYEVYEELLEEASEIKKEILNLQKQITKHEKD